MDPVAFTILGKPIYWYGVLVALAFVAGTVHWSLLGRREGRPANFASDLALVIMIAGVLGGRIAYVLANAPHYLQHPAELIRIDKGGLVFYGGFIGASVAALVMARMRREPALSLLDFAVTAVPIGHAFGRVGCFVNGCCYGTPWNGPWAVMFDGAFRHPVQLYEAVFNVALYIALLVFYPRRKRDGSTLALYLLSYGTWRFVAEFFRGDARINAGALHVSQWTSIVIIAAGVALALLARPRGKTGEPAHEPA
jgi:phosphatidylglycerol:prolipoprotein diacylglycerol transferase